MKKVLPIVLLLASSAEARPRAMSPADPVVVRLYEAQGRESAPVSFLSEGPVLYVRTSECGPGALEVLVDEEVRPALRERGFTEARCLRGRRVVDRLAL